MFTVVWLELICSPWMDYSLETWRKRIPEAEQGVIYLKMNECPVVTKPSLIIPAEEAGDSSVCEEFEAGHFTVVIMTTMAANN